VTLRYSPVLSATHAEARFFGYDVEYTTPRRSRGVGRPSSRTRPSYPRWCVEERGGLLLLRTQEPMMRESSAMAWEAFHEDKWVTISQDFDDGVFVPCSRPTEMAMQHTELKTGACWRMRSETRCSGEAWGCHPAMGAPRAVSGDNGGWVFKGEAPSECLW
jgi:hypothetical protein